MNGWQQRSESFFTALGRRPRTVLAVVLLLSVSALLAATRLRLSTDLPSLLPDGSPAAADYRTFLERFGGLNKVFVLVLPASDATTDATDASVDEDLLVEAASRLEEILAESPEVASVRAGLATADEEFFRRYVAPRAPLTTGEPAALAARLEPPAVARRVAELKAALATPGGGFAVTLARGDPLGLGEELTAQLTPGTLPLHPLTGTFLAPAGDAALLILTPARAEIDPEGGRALAAALAAAEAQVRGELGDGVDVQAVGGPLYAAHDEALIREDLIRTITGSLIGTALILLLAFEGAWLPLAALAPLAVALTWTGGWLGLFHSEIAGVSLGFAAVLIGLGIDYGIHAGARFRQEQLALGDPVRALVATARHTGPGILSSALTTAAGFAILGLAHLRPLRELGQMVAVGILAILLAATVAGAAALVLVARHTRPPGPLWRLLGRAVERAPELAARRPWPVLAAAAVLSLVALWGLGRLAVSADLRAMRPEDHPLLAAEELLVDRFGLGVDTATVVVPGDSLDGALTRAAAAAAVLRRDLGPDVAITTPSDLLAPAPAERLRQLARLPFARAAEDLERELRAANLSPAAFGDALAALRAFGRGEDPGVPPPASWPDWLAESLHHDADGWWAALEVRLPAGRWPDGPPPALVADVRAAAPGAALASAAAIGAELRDLATRDLEQLGLLALVAVSLVVAVSFRGRWRPTLLAALPVVLGALWTLGLWSALGRTIDLFGLAVLPILLGIGIDDGLHVVHGARQDPAAGVVGATRAAGRAIFLTSVTTCVGFGSLMLSRIPGLRSGGVLIAGGVLLCLLCTLFVLPAVAAVTRRAR